MTYHLLAVRGPLTFSMNSGLMRLLCAAMVESGVRLDRHSTRSCDSVASHVRQLGTLLTCFTTNDGWHVTAPEARDIADSIDEALPDRIAAPKRIHHHEVLLSPPSPASAANPPNGPMLTR